MAAEPGCLVDEYYGIERYFRFEGECSKRRIVKEAGPRANEPLRAVNDLSQRTHEKPSALGVLNRVYPDAIEIGSVFGFAKAKLVLPAFGLFGVGIMTFYAGYKFFLSDFIFFHIFSFVILAIGTVAFLCVWMAIRMLLFGNVDAPILFSRKTRQVAVYHVHFPHFLKVWEGPRQYCTTHDWDLTRVRTYARTATGGAMATTRTDLYLLWGQADDPKRLTDYARLGGEGRWEDADLFMLWEYVRRYMEEDGPAIPPGERLGFGFERPSPFPLNIIEAAGGAPLSREQVAQLAVQEDTT